jgi:uncharacterized protein YdeI (YjbR/CyaY-like superfamily)
MDATTDTSRLKRQIYDVPEDIRAALEAHGVVAAYAARPAYQQNDYVGWITRAKRTETRQKRLDQMLEELKAGGVYMRMKWSGEVS